MSAVQLDECRIGVTRDLSAYQQLSPECNRPLLLGSRGSIQSLEERFRPELGEDVPGFFGAGGVWVIGAEQQHEVQLAQSEVERALERPPRLDGSPVGLGRLLHSPF